LPSSRPQPPLRGSEALPADGRSSTPPWAGYALALGWLLVSPAFQARAAVADHLESLASLHAVSGDEAEALGYIGGWLGARAVSDNTGSLTVTFGEGASHTLLVAGVDEPGYVVSGIHEEGYLRLERLADPAPHYQFDRFFLGQPVSVRTSKGVLLAGSVAAPAVHFDSGQPSPYRTGNPGDLFVDVGAASSAEVSKAGVGVLDSVALVKRFVRLGRSKVSAPWISSRAGAAILLELASRLAENPPTGRVTLAFVTGQYYRQQGLLAAIRRMAPSQVVLLRPGGDRKLEVGRLAGVVSVMPEKLLSLARENGWPFERGSSVSLELGPFGPAKIFGDGVDAAVITLGAEHAGTPVETVDLEALNHTARLLAQTAGAIWRDSPPSPVVRQEGDADPAGPAGFPLDSLIKDLLETQGVSRSETAVREKIRARLPSFARQRTFVDERGNVVVPLGGEGKPGAVFIAHMDEIGHEVERIEDTGRVHAKAVGGILEDLFAWRPVVLNGAKGLVNAIMAGSRQIDLGVGSREETEAAGVRVGDPVTVPKSYRRLLGTRVSGRSLDDRAGCAVLIAALEQLAARATSFQQKGPPVWVVFSAEEETGLMGAAFIADRTAPARVYAIDSFVSSDSPLEDRRIAYAPLGAGFVIRAIDESGMAPRREVQRVIALASRHGIPMQVGVTAGGNDGSRFVPAGAVNVPLSWPLRYAHTPAEVADLRDVEALMRITTALMDEELSGAAAN